jgi:general secretion pathway protein K
VSRVRREKGIALIVVLWTLALLSIVAVAFSSETRTSARIARNGLDSAVSRAAADAGIYRGMLLAALPQTDTAKVRPGGTVYSWRFSNCLVRISIEAERGKVDLEHAPEVLLAALFESVGTDHDIAQSLAAAVADFRDPDSLRRLHGAEEAEYRAAGLAWGPKNAPFEAVEELQEVLGITPTIYQRVAPYLTIYSVAGEINPTSASDLVIGALQKAQLDEGYFVQFPGMAYSIRAEAKDSRGAVFVREAVVQLDREKPVPIRILAWRQGD